MILQVSIPVHAHVWSKQKPLGHVERLVASNLFCQLTHVMFSPTKEVVTGFTCVQQVVLLKTNYSYYVINVITLY